MAEYIGKDADYRWIWSGGTVNFSADHRTFNYAPSVELHDATAGSDAAKGYIAGVKDGAMTLTIAHQGGTALDAACAEGVGGTLIWSPEGTIAGKPKHTAPAICQGLSYNPQYNAIVEYQIQWQQNGLRVDATW